MILNLFEKRVGEQLIQQQILLAEADKLGIHASDDDVITYLHQGAPGQVIFPGGKFIGTDAYTNLIANRFQISVKEFESEVKSQIVIQRLQALITAGVTVNDQEVREDYRKGNIKIKFDYAVISSDDLKKGINPSDTELEAFFTKNAARYATAIPEQRTATYFAFTPNELRAGFHSRASRRFSSTLARTRPNTRSLRRPGRGTFLSRLHRGRTPRPMLRPRPRRMGC